MHLKAQIRTARTSYCVVDNLGQLPAVNRGELVDTDELAEASKKLREAADELLNVIRG